jgi:hypothetical protein
MQGFSEAHGKRAYKKGGGSWGGKGDLQRLLSASAISNYSAGKVGQISS